MDAPRRGGAALAVLAVEAVAVQVDAPGEKSAQRAPSSVSNRIGGRGARSAAGGAGATSTAIGELAPILGA